tara:strand:+ start:1001 stop:1336 length:336 start_codon:yes stop_codon:yes gene_type:complete
MEAQKKRTRSSGAYNVGGKKVKIVQSRDKHKLWDDLFHITESQITKLKEKVLDDEELDSKDMQKLDGCFNGMKKLLEIETQLRSDQISKLTDEELIRLAQKTIRERKQKND